MAVLNSEGAESEKELHLEAKFPKKKVEKTEHKSLLQKSEEVIAHFFKEVVRVPYHLLDHE